MVIYPNPVEDGLRILSKKTPKSISVFDVNGMLVLELKANNTLIDVSKLIKGCYFVRLNYEDEIKTIKFIKK